MQTSPCPVGHPHEASHSHCILISIETVEWVHPSHHHLRMVLHGSSVWTGRNHFPCIVLSLTQPCSCSGHHWSWLEIIIGSLDITEDTSHRTHSEDTSTTPGHHTDDVPKSRQWHTDIPTGDVPMSLWQPVNDMPTPHWTLWVLQWRAAPAVLYHKWFGILSLLLWCQCSIQWRS